MENRGKKVEKSEVNVKHKSFILLIKYSFHLSAFCCMLYTILEFCDIDAIILGHLIHISLYQWFFMYMCSKVFRFCYVHRLPLYYIACNELITLLDYYIHIPLDVLQLLMLHLSLMIALIFGYTYYYVRTHKKGISTIHR